MISKAVTDFCNWYKKTNVLVKFLCNLGITFRFCNHSVTQAQSSLRMCSGWSFMLLYTCSFKRLRYCYGLRQKLIHLCLSWSMFLLTAGSWISTFSMKWSLFTRITRSVQTCHDLTVRGNKIFKNENNSDEGLHGKMQVVVITAVSLLCSYTFLQFYNNKHICSHDGDLSLFPITVNPVAT
jgi:hypothetical protein